MNPELIAQIENMSEEEKQALLQTQFPEELEKEAADELLQSQLVDALYNYGALSAERAVAEVSGEGDLSKVASAEEIQAHEEAEAQVGALIEEAIQALGISESGDELTLHKTAQTCAAIIFQGYTDAVERLVETSNEVAPTVEKLAHAAIEKIASQEGVTRAPWMDKTASEMTFPELYNAINGISELESNLDKLASASAAQGGKMKEMLNKAKDALSKGADKAKGALSKGADKVKAYHKGIAKDFDDAKNGALIGMSGKERAMAAAKGAAKLAPHAAVAGGGGYAAYRKLRKKEK